MKARSARAALRDTVKNATEYYKFTDTLFNSRCAEYRGAVSLLGHTHKPHSVPVRVSDYMAATRLLKVAMKKERAQFTPKGF